MVGQYVVTLGADSSVHVGILHCCDGTNVELHSCSNLWRWRGAHTLHEVSLRGVDTEFSRISEQVARLILTNVVKIIPCTPEAETNLRQVRWGT